MLRAGVATSLGGKVGYFFNVFVPFTSIYYDTVDG